jgi:hypothetical protein
MSSDEEKINLARTVSSEITQESFEEEMAVMHNAIKQCWDNRWE